MFEFVLQDFGAYGVRGRSTERGRQSTRNGGAIAPSRCCPPTPAVNQETTAPKSAAAPAMNAKITPLRRARLILLRALTMAASVRLSASAGARPTRLDTRRIR